MKLFLNINVVPLLPVEGMKVNVARTDSSAGLTNQNLVILMVHLQQLCVIPCRFVLEVTSPPVISIR
jgi:hypothetical protein